MYLLPTKNIPTQDCKKDLRRKCVRIAETRIKVPI